MTRIVFAVILLWSFALAPSRPARAEDDAGAVQETSPSLRTLPEPLPTRSANPPSEFGLGALQLAAGYGAEVGGGLLLAESGFNPKSIGVSSDYQTLVLVTSVAPAIAAGAVCGVGAISRSYAGGCATSFLGAYAGALVGVALGFLLAPAPNPDDTVAFQRSMTGLVGMALLSPVGALIGHELGKHPIW